jgi:coenzyme Q-binding protein COQ10
MDYLTIRKRIRHRWADLFNLVAELKSYPNFVPCCQRVRVFSRKADGPDKTVIISRMTVGLSALQVSYANRTVADLAAREIRVDAIDGPLRHLRVVWKFNPDGEEWTEIAFAVTYEFSSPILGALASRMFDSMFRDIVDAFERRADHVFGRAESQIRTSTPRSFGSVELAVSR